MNFAGSKVSNGMMMGWARAHGALKGLKGRTTRGSPDIFAFLMKWWRLRARRKQNHTKPTEKTVAKLTIISTCYSNQSYRLTEDKGARRLIRLFYHFIVIRTLQILNVAFRQTLAIGAKSGPLSPLPFLRFTSHVKRNK